MSYIKKEFRALLDLTDRKFIIPKTFQKFISEKEKTHNLIIKSKKEYRCTNCGYIFQCKAKVNQSYKCPNCKQKLLVKTARLTHYVFWDNLQLFDKIQDKFVIRNDSVTQVMKEILDKNIDSLIQERAKDLEKNIYKNNQFIVFPAPSLKELRDEAEQQHNCVYKNYSKSYATGKCDIYFLRLLTQPHTSFVTIEVRGQQIVQSKMKYNNPVAPNILPFLESWEKKVLEKV